MVVRVRQLISVVGVGRILRCIRGSGRADWEGRRVMSRSEESRESPVSDRVSLFHACRGVKTPMDSQVDTAFSVLEGCITKGSETARLGWTRETVGVGRDTIVLADWNEKARAREVLVGPP